MSFHIYSYSCLFVSIQSIHINLLISIQSIHISGPCRLTKLVPLQSRVYAIAFTSIANNHTSSIIFPGRKAYLFDGILLQDCDEDGRPTMLEVEHWQVEAMLNCEHVKHIVVFAE